MKFVLTGTRGTSLGACSPIIAWFMLSAGLLSVASSHFDYKVALTKSIIFLEAQRSGKLPPNHRPSWRGDSALTDGQLANVDLVGGYYDAGDNVKYGLPMAFTVTTLSWAAISYQSELKAARELANVRAAVRWGTDYLLKASAKDNLLYVQIAAETSAAMAAASIVLRRIDRAYAQRLVQRSESLFNFAKTHKGTYDGECPFYCSNSGFNDELLWAATWLHKATGRSMYMDYIKDEAISAAVSEFSWDLKYAGAQVLLSKYYLEGQKDLHTYKEQADSFVCSVLPDSPHHQVPISPGGLLYLRDGANSQYVTSTAFLFSVYSDLLGKHKQEVDCGDKKFGSARLMAFAKQQMDYLLGKNPRKASYMVGFGKKPPTQAHHRGSSVPVMSPDKEISCPMSFVYWYNTDKPNPNELTGAIIGGPDGNDNFIDQRASSSYTEPTTYINSLAIGVLAKLARQSHAQS